MDDEIERSPDEYQINLAIMSLEADRQDLERKRAEQQQK